MRRSTWLSVVAVLTMVAAAGAWAPEARAASPLVEITDTALKPADVTIVAGDVVTWKNTSAALHRIVADDGSFDSGPLSLNDQFANLFEVPGTFTYRDPDQPDLAGVVRVTAAAPTATPNGTPAPTPPGGTLPPDFNTPVPVPTASGTTASPVPSPSPAPTESASPAPSPAGTRPGDQPLSGGRAPIAILAVLAVTVVAALAWSRRRP